MLLSCTNNLNEAKFFNMSYLAEFKENTKESSNHALIYANKSCYLSSIDNVQLTKLIYLPKTFVNNHGFTMKFSNYTNKSKECSIFEIYSLKTNTITKVFTLTQENRPFGNFKMITAINSFTGAFERIIKEISKELR